MKVIFSHPTGNQNSRNVALGLLKNDMLCRFYTTIGIFSDSYLQCFNQSIFSEIKKRTYDASLRPFTSFHPYKEIGRLFSQKMKFKKLLEQHGRFSSYNIYADLDRFVAEDFIKYNPDLIYGYGDGALNTFAKAKEKNVKTVYDLSACYWRMISEIVENEKEKQPLWSDTMDSIKKADIFKDRCDAELRLSDKIIVASDFCKRSLAYFPEKLPEIKVIPYGFPTPYDNRTYLKKKKLQVLFVGKLTQQKGLSYLFDAVEYFRDHIELTIIGSKPIQKHSLLEKKLTLHNYIGTLPHNKVLEIMRQSDLLIFPSIMDAFGMVITEAMSQGTPVITTEASAGPELIEHGENGWIVKSGDSNSIKIILEQLLLKNNCNEIGANALKKATQRFWFDYQKDVCDYLNELK